MLPSITWLILLLAFITPVLATTEIHRQHGLPPILRTLALQYSKRGSSDSCEITHTRPQSCSEQKNKQACQTLPNHETCVWCEYKDPKNDQCIDTFGGDTCPPPPCSGWETESKCKSQSCVWCPFNNNNKGGCAYTQSGCEQSKCDRIYGSGMETACKQAGCNWCMGKCVIEPCKTRPPPVGECFGLPQEKCIPYTCFWCGADNLPEWSNKCVPYTHGCDSNVLPLRDRRPPPPQPPVRTTRKPGGHSCNERSNKATCEDHALYPPCTWQGTCQDAPPKKNCQTNNFSSKRICEAVTGCIWCTANPYKTCYDPVWESGLCSPLPPPTTPHPDTSYCGQFDNGPTCDDYNGHWGRCKWCPDNLPNTPCIPTAQRC